MTEKIKILALRLLDRFDLHISAKLLLLGDRSMSWRPWFYKEGERTGFTGLHGVAYLEIVEVARAVLDMKQWDVNVADCTRSTALIWAAIRGHGEVVEMLLEREDINPSQADTEYGRTPLLWAAEKGNGGVVKMLLE